MFNGGLHTGLRRDGWYRNCTESILLLLSVLISGSTSWASGNEIRIGFSALRISLPVFVAQERGMFVKQGLKVELERFDTAQPLVEALATGRIEVGGYMALPILLTVLGRSPREVMVTTALYEDATHPISSLLVGPRLDPIEGVRGLRGRTIGILPTVAYRKWLELILEAHGMSSDSVKMTSIAPHLSVMALQSGQIDALFTNDPARTAAIAAGTGRIIGGEKTTVPEILGNPFLFGTFCLTKEFVARNPEQSKALVAALNEAVEFIMSNQEDAKLAMQSYLHPAQQALVKEFPDSFYVKSTQVNREVMEAAIASAAQHKVVDRGVSLEVLK